MRSPVTSTATSCLPTRRSGPILALGCIVGAVTWVLAPLYASVIDQPEITPVVRCLAVLVPVSSLSGIHTARKLGEFGHKAVAARMMSSSALGGAAAVAAAIAGLGVWSLVIQTAIVDVVGIIFAWQTYPWWPRLRFDVRRLRDVCGFSGIMMLTQVLGLLLTRIQDVVIGRYISVAAVGTYRIAWRMIDLIAQTTIQPMVGVSFVTLSQLQDDRERFRQAFLRMLGLGALLTFPAISGFGVLSSEIIPLLFGSKWAAQCRHREDTDADGNPVLHELLHRAGAGGDRPLHDDRQGFRRADRGHPRAVAARRTFRSAMGGGRLCAAGISDDAVSPGPVQTRHRDWHRRDAARNHAAIPCVVGNGCHAVACRAVPPECSWAMALHTWR